MYSNYFSEARTEQILSNPIYIVSDLHKCGAGKNDSFMGKRTLYYSLMECVADTKGLLIINGDDEDLWRSSIWSIYMAYKELYAYQKRINHIKIVGNHDFGMSNLSGFYGFEAIPYLVLGNLFFMHGNAADIYNDTPEKPGRYVTFFINQLEKRGLHVDDYYRKFQQYIPPRSRGDLINDVFGEYHFDNVIPKLLPTEKLTDIVFFFGHTHTPGFGCNLGKRWINSGSWEDQQNTNVVVRYPNETLFLGNWQADKLIKYESSTFDTKRGAIYGKESQLGTET